MNFSDFGRRFTRMTGTRELMDDLGEAMASDHPVLMLGGGNPSNIPAVEELIRQRLLAIAGDEVELRRTFGNYSPSHGDIRFRHALAGLLRREFGWDVGTQNVCLTVGSQGSFFSLFNLLAGRFGTTRKRILLPLTPEYIGYMDVGLVDDFFVAQRPSIEHLDDGMFKYHVDFEKLNVDESVGAICVSRPTNPTGNVLTDGELHQLDQIAREAKVPLIVDNAYGVPFPHITFVDATPIWNDNIILCMTLSKLGLPGIRNGIVIANEEIVDAVASINAIVNLAVPSVGAGLLQEWVDSGDIIRISRELITPHYLRKAEQAVEWFQEELAGVDFHIHKPEGAIFLWLWFPNLPIACSELYRRLKARDVLVISGHHFFSGLAKDWDHRHQCIRVTYSQDPEMVRQGIRIIAEEVIKAMEEADTGLG